MINIKHIESLGGTRKALKALFDTPKPAPKVKRLIDLSEARMHDGVRSCLRNSRIYDAIDAAMDVCKRQITFSFVSDLIAKGKSGEQVMAACKSWPYTRDLDYMLVDCVDEDGNVVKNPDGSCKQKLDLPAFFHIFVPLAFGYLGLRASKIFNDLHQYPFLPYPPIKESALERTRSKLITARGQRMVSEMGYVQDVRQGIYRTLKHGRCIWLAKEPYYFEHQYDESGKKRVEREGVRWDQFHPNRVFFDSSHRLSSLNTDTGCQFVGGWSMRRWGEIRMDKTLWNRDRVSRGYPTDISGIWGSYGIGRECIGAYPAPATSGMKDDRLESQYYLPTDEFDQLVIQAPLYQKIVPKEWGLYDYAGPVWHRFLFGGWGTVMSVEPWAYPPGFAFEGDGDQDQDTPTGLALQMVPFQDHLTNLLVQYILAVKGNLERLVLINADYVDKPTLQRLANVGRQWYAATQYVPYSEREVGAMGIEASKLLTNVQREPQNVSEIATLINNLLAIMERMLGFSAQELGQPATHEQTSAEVRIIATNSGERLRTTRACIEEGLWALRDRIYRAWMAYGSNETLAEVADLTLDDVKELKSLGYKVEEPDPKTGRRGVSGKKSNLEIDGFASRRTGEDLARDQDIANAMVSVFQAVANNQVIADRLGPDVVIDLFNQILRYAGVPDDYRLSISEAAKKRMESKEDGVAQPNPDGQPNGIEQVLDVLNQKIEQVAKSGQQADVKIASAIASLKQEIAQLMAGIKQTDQQQNQVIMASLERIKTLSDHVAQIGQTIAQPPAGVVAPAA